MRRREPPQFATWMMEHLMPGDCDEAVSGDLLEVYRSGRSDDWYWRQALAACALSWLRSLRARLNLFVFVLFWSMLAPAWEMVCQRVDGTQVQDKISQLAGGAWLIPAFGLWLLVHTLFLWAGAVLFVSSHTHLRDIFRNSKTRRALLLAPIVFAPVYGATFVLANLYWWSPLLVHAHGHLAATPLGQITDLGLLANIYRIPYGFALLVALWTAIPQTHRPTSLLMQRGVDLHPWLEQEPSAVTAVDAFTQKQVMILVVAAGLVNAMIAAFVFCRLPDIPVTNLGSLWLRAALYVLIGACAGVAGSWAYWMSPWSPLREKAPIPFTSVGLASAASWVWVPAIVLYLEQVSWAGVIVSIVAAGVLAKSVHGAVHAATLRAAPATAVLPLVGSDLFAESLYRPPLELHAYLIVFCLCVAGFALATHSNYTAALMLAVSAFVFRWKGTLDKEEGLATARANRRSAGRVLRMAIAAVFVTMWALMTGVASREHPAGAKSAANIAPQHTARQAAIAQQGEVQSLASGRGGYVSIILRVPAAHDKIAAPMTAEQSLIRAQGLKQPLTLQFDGAYWYLQPPDRQPGQNAHRASGSPLDLDIRSGNNFPVVMEAYQYLGRQIRISQCREIDVTLANSDNRAGAISLALLLTNGMTSDQSTFYAGQQPIVSTLLGNFVNKSSPALETIRFFIPGRALVRQFDGLTLEFLPDIEHTFVAPKIAVRQLQIFPR